MESSSIPVKRVCVVGGGVVGLSTAYCLARSGVSNLQVTLISEKFSPNTTGDGAAGKWYPSHLSQTSDSLVRKWGSVTYQWLLDLAYSEFAVTAGVSLVSGYHFFETNKEEPFWKDLVLNFRRASMREIDKVNESGCYHIKDGWFYTTFFLNCETYLPWLLSRFKKLGGNIEQRRIDNLSELASQFDCAVNCTGLGSYQLVQDKSVYPIYGQVARIRAPWIKHFFSFYSNDGRDTYIMPRATDVVLGIYNEANKWSKDVDEEVHNEIMDRVYQVMPSLKDAPVFKKWSGMRPARPCVRLELEKVNVNGRALPVVHNYGHGGSGITLHLGCAINATKLVLDALKLKTSTISYGYDFCQFISKL